MKKILILGAGIYQVPLIKKAKENNFYTIVVSIPGQYPGFKFADKVYYNDTRDKNAVMSICRDENVSGVLTAGTDVAISTIGEVCEKLNLTGISSETGYLCTNKMAMKETFSKHHVNTPKFLKVNNLGEAVDAFKFLSKPVVFKAVDSSGSRGISIVDSDSEINKAYKYAKMHTEQNYIVVEEYIKGLEFGAQSSIIDDKIQFILNHGDMLFQGDANVPIGHYVPIDLSAEIEKKIYDELEKCRIALKLNNCVINADFILRENSVLVLEIGARAGATALPELVSIHYGVDYYQYLIDLSLGLKPTLTIADRTPCAGMLLSSKKTGKIKRIINKNDEDEDGIDISFDYNVGDHVREFKVGPDRIGQVLVKGKEIESVRKKLDLILSNIIIEVEDIE
jgi:biotin carboxylase